MSVSDRWLLPEGVEELLPNAARRAEALRRALLDLFDAWGYELVMPPLIEYLDALLTGVGSDLDLQTIKVTDQMTGRLMGVRADITPQAARLDAHYLKREVPVRLCYIGPVLRARPGAFASREPLQVGAELFGHAGVESDAEVLRLMIAALECAGVTQPVIDLGHVGIFRALARAAGLTAAQEARLFDALQRKASPEVETLLRDWAMPESARAALASLPLLNGGREVLAEASQRLAHAGPDVARALEELVALADAVSGVLPAARLHCDLAELHGYRYYTGVVFSAFVPGRGDAIARGGRYDEIGRAFGRARPAVGFGTDLRVLLALRDNGAPRGGVMAPYGTERGLDQAVTALRARGERVVVRLPNAPGDARALGCDRELVFKDGKWQVVVTNEAMQ